VNDRGRIRAGPDSWRSAGAIAGRGLLERAMAWISAAAFLAAAALRGHGLAIAGGATIAGGAAVAVNSLGLGVHRHLQCWGWLDDPNL